jgi:hypothetical protein
MRLKSGVSAGFVFLAALFGEAAAEGKNCFNSSINGTYGVIATGTAIGVGPVALVALFSFDGDGHTNGTVFQKVNGNNVQVTFTGTYTVDPTCIVTDSVVLSNGQTATHTYILVDNGSEFYILNTTPPTATSGNVVSGVGKRQ